MALPTGYLTTQKNLDGILTAIQTAKAPAKFTQGFLAALGYKSSSDRLVINVLKNLGLLSADGVPTQRYFEFLDQTQSGRVMAEGMTDAYADLFELNVNAQNMSRAELKNKMRTLSQGKLNDSVLDKMAMTFTALAKQAEFESLKTVASEGNDRSELPPPSPEVKDKSARAPEDPPPKIGNGGLAIEGLVYNIQIQLPESRDPKVYDALFESLAKHLRS